jgi:transposase
LIAVAVWSELGDCRRFSRSEQAVRHTGLDRTVDASDRRRAGGYLSRHGPETLRWALYEAAKNSSHRRSPDHAYYAQVKDRHDGKIAAISMARKLALGISPSAGRVVMTLDGIAVPTRGERRAGGCCAALSSCTS